MNKNEASEIVKFVLQKQGKTDLQIHDISYKNESVIIAKVSYTWQLNGHEKNVSSIERTFYLDEKENWKTY